MDSAIPIQVRATPTRAQINAAVRQTIIALGAIAGTLGYSGIAGKLNMALAMAGPIASFIAFVWGQIETRHSAQTLAVVADAAPDTVATVK